MILLPIELTLLPAIALVALRLMRNSSAAARHSVCAMALGASLMLPAVRLVPAAPGMTFRIPAARSVSRGVRASGTRVPWWPAVWAMGTAVLLARMAVGYAWAARVVKAGQAENGYLLADVGTPMVTGLFRPVILVPRGWPDEQLEAALRHERAHLERNDLITNLMAHVACAVYWFHPLVWAVAVRMRREQEAACDDAVLRSGVGAADYAAALVATARQFTAHGAPNADFMGCQMLTQKTLRNRIARVLDNGVPRMTSSAAPRRAAIVLAAALGCIALLNAADDQVYRIGAGVSPPHVVSKVDPVYTPEAKDAKVEGAVKLSVVVGSDGVAHDINVIEPLDAGLDVKAVEAVQKWRFEPAMKDGKPVAVKATIEVNFRLL